MALVSKLISSPINDSTPAALKVLVDAYLATLPAGTEVLPVSLGPDMLILSGTGINGTQSGITRTEVDDVAYAILGGDVLVAYTAISAERIVSLPAAATAGAGRSLIIMDESGDAGSFNIVITPDGTEEINEVNAAVDIAVGFGFIELYCDGSNWFTRSQRLIVENTSIARTETAAAYAVLPTDALVAYTAIAAERIVTLPAAATAGAGRIVTIIDEAGAAGTYNLVITPDGTEEINGVNAVVDIAVDYGFITLECDGSNWTIIASKLIVEESKVARTAVSDAAYAVLPTDALIAYTAISAGRAVTLPTVAIAGAGRHLIVADESGAAGTYNIAVTPDGSEEIDGANSSVDIAVHYGFLELYCTGTAWVTLGQRIA